MSPFLARFSAVIFGVLSGFDRIRFRGTQRMMANSMGLTAFLQHRSVLLKDFKSYAVSTTDRLRQDVVEHAQAVGVPIHYLNDSSISKEELANDLAQKAGRTTGLRAILSALEPCRTFYVRKNPETGHLELQNRLGKCLHYYHYWLDEKLGPCHVRLQSWFPFNVFVCVNGREMLAQDLRREGIPFRQRDNCFSWVKDLPRAQELLDAQVDIDWSAELTRLVGASHPKLATWPGLDRQYYWSAEQTEWATDVMFESCAELSRRMPDWIGYAMTSMNCGQVMRFLGRPTTKRGAVHGHFEGEVGIDTVRRPEGTCVSFRANRNRVKFYDKQGSVLRIETTIAEARDMKSYQASESDPNGKKGWRKMKKGVSDLPRRTKISQKVNERCLEALATVNPSKSLVEATDGVCRRTTWKGRGVRALNPLAPQDRELLATIGRGEYLLSGFRNRDLQAALQVSSSQATRLLMILRGHGLIKKVQKSHRYLVTKKGREILGALDQANQMTEKFTQPT